MTIRIVGLGPGEADLVAVRGARQLASATRIVAPAALHAVIREHAPTAPLEVPVASPLEEARTLAAHVSAGERVCRVFPEDPFVSAGASRLAEALRGLGVPFTVVPGLVRDVTAASELGASYFRSEDPTPSYAVIEVTNDHLGTFAWERLATATDTLIVDVIGADVAEIARTLTFHGRPESTPAACSIAGVEGAGRTDVVAGTLGTLARAFASRRVPEARLVVGSGARATPGFVASQPLFGKRVLVTRARSQAGDLADLLRDEGAIPVFLPVIGFAPSDDPEGLARACRALAEGTYRAVLFTSQNGVTSFVSALRSLGLDARAFAKARVGAVGPATAKALETFGIKADFVATEHVGEGLASDALDPLGPLGPASAGDKVLLPRAKVARDVLPEALRGAGFEVDVVTAYVTEKLAVGRDETAEVLQALASGALAAVTVTSSSTAEALVEALGAGGAGAEALSRVVVASVGKVTTATAEGLGVRVGITASSSTLPALVLAMRDHFAAIAR